jgi:glycerophosphoryl diester phosphodiesterase
MSGLRGAFWRFVICGFAGAVLMTTTSPAAPHPDQARPFVIAHRGASGYVPEHTLPGYFIAIQQGTDYVEPDLVITRDGELVARHENEIGGTTDVAAHAEFASRKTTKNIDGKEVTGWFTEDFTLAELKTLRARERLPNVRKDNTRYDGQFQIPTFDEVLDLVAKADAQRAEVARAAGRPPPPRIGVYPETKHPSYFAKLNLHFDERMLATLTRHGYTRRSDPICLQSFEVANLKALRQHTDLPLVQLVAPVDRGPELRAAGVVRERVRVARAAGASVRMRPQVGRARRGQGRPRAG